MSIPAARDVHVSGEETEEDQGWMDGWCTDTDGGRLADFSFLGNMLSAKECLAACKEIDAATGCEFLFESICYVHTREVVSSSRQFFSHHSFEAKCIAFLGKLTTTSTPPTITTKSQSDLLKMESADDTHIPVKRS